MILYILGGLFVVAMIGIVARQQSNTPDSGGATSIESRFRRSSRAVAMAVVLAAGVTLAACGGSSGSSSESKSMPAVVGKKLDVALSEIKTAGFTGKVDVSGGGTFGVVNESNWEVCTQSPDAGEPLTDTPKLAVDRSCGGSSESAAASTSSSAPPTTVSEVVLSAANNPELAAILADSNDCSDSIQAFALKYAGRTIEFDGNIANMVNHEEMKTRYDFLIRPGDFSTTRAVGPNFKFENVNATYDLRLTGPNIPAYVGEGNNLHFVVKIVEFNKTQCLFYVKPVSTSVR